MPFLYGQIIDGVVKNAETNKILEGASIEILKPRFNAISNDRGYFRTQRLSVKQVTISVRYVGFLVNQQKINLDSDTTLIIYLTPFSTDIEEVVIKDKENEIQNTKLGLTSLSQKQILNVPSIGSEHDIARVLTLTPGVKSDNEANAGLYVRGGSSDQNLFLLDNNPLYKNSHFFGFLSTFNSDVIQKIDFYKGGFPAKFGGRLSSVLDIKTKPASLTQYKINGTIGVLSSRLTAELPVIKNQLSVLLAFRRSYFDIFTRLFSINSVSEPPIYYFYDFNGKVLLKLNEKHSLQFFVYQDRDRLTGGTTNETENLKYNQKWSSTITGLSLNSYFNSKITNQLEVSSSGYAMNLDSYRKQNNEETNNNFSNSIHTNSIRNTIEISPNAAYQIQAGGVFNRYLFRPANLNFVGNNIAFVSNIDSVRSNEAALFVENQVNFRKIKLNAGLRYVSYQVNSQSYRFWEPRLQGSYQHNQSSIKLAYSIMNQPLHLLTNTGFGIPVDLWFSSTNKILPQSSQQISITYTRDFTSNQANSTLNLSIELYHKTLNRTISYRDGFSSQNFTELSQNSVREWDKVVTTGQGWSDGAEFLLQKRNGDLTGWVGYTLSWTKNQFDELNNGNPFFARNDRRHDFSLVLSYKLKKRWQFNANWICQTGQAITLPTAVYDAPSYNFISDKFGNYVPILFSYGQRNSYRMKPTHRLDVSIQRKTTHKWGIGMWEVSVYNLYNRKNPYFYYLALGEGIKSVSLLPIIPSLSYTFNIYTKPVKSQ